MKTNLLQAQKRYTVPSDGICGSARFLCAGVFLAIIGFSALGVMWLINR